MSTNNRRAILPGGVLGILGGGQLGRMTAMAARSYGYRVQVLDPDPACPARFVVDSCVTADFTDARAAAGLARGCDVVTLEIESIAKDALLAAAAFAPLRPAESILAITQDRISQKSWLQTHGFPVAPFAVARTAEELERALLALGGRCFVKRSTGGYDGRGQYEARSAEDAGAAWQALGQAPCVVEQALELRHELSVMVARRPSGDRTVFPLALNHHEERVLSHSVLPPPPTAVSETLGVRARELSLELSAALGLEGLLAVELFLTAAGELYVNEMAPRPHNTFHGTERACATSQFEQHVRAVCDLPLGEVSLIRPAAIANLLGEVWLGPTPPDFSGALTIPTLRLHLYEKRTPRAGRKMGHLSAMGDSPEQALERVLAARRLITGDDGKKGKEKH